MDRFDDPREGRERTKYEDPRDTRQLTMPEDSGNANKKPLSLQELINQEASLAAGLSKEMSAISEGGTASERNKLLSMAEREALLEKKCAIFSRYQADYQKEYEKYRLSLSKFDHDRIIYGQAMYAKGLATGEEQGKAEGQSELQPTIAELIRSRNNLRFNFWIATVYSVLMTGMVIFCLFHMIR